MHDARGASRGARAVGDRQDVRGNGRADKVRALAAPEAAASAAVAVVSR